MSVVSLTSLLYSMLNVWLPGAKAPCHSPLLPAYFSLPAMDAFDWNGILCKPSEHGMLFTLTCKMIHDNCMMYLLFSVAQVRSTHQFQSRLNFSFQSQF